MKFIITTLFNLCSSLLSLIIPQALTLTCKNYLCQQLAMNLSGPLWPDLNCNSKQVTLYSSSVPIPGNRPDKRIARLSPS